MTTCDCGNCWIRRTFPDYELPTPCIRPQLMEAPDDEPTLPGGWDVELPHYVEIRAERGL